LKCRQDRLVYTGQKVCLTGGCPRALLRQGRRGRPHQAGIRHVLHAGASINVDEGEAKEVRGAICENRREIAHTRLEAIAGADNPYSLITIFGRGHLAIKAGGAVYVTRCSPVEVIPRSHGNCTEEIPVSVNGTDAFVDPISYVIKSAGSPIHCNEWPRRDTKYAVSGTAATRS
jgi:hypothetical protein